MEKKYYLPISSTSLVHYFGCACIKPSKYFDNKPKDLQDKFNDFLLVTTRFGIQQTDCCLELIFTDQEVKEDLIKIGNDFYLYQKPLPITRVKKIYFLSKKQRELTITDINMTDAFIPDNLIGDIKDFENPQIDIEKPQDIHIAQYNEKLKRFNSCLGGLALMRLAGEEDMNYSENYFATLAFFNTMIQQDLEYSKINIDTRYRGAFTGENGFQKIIPYLNKTIDETDINNMAQDEGQVIKKDKTTRIIDLNTLDKWTYTIAVLNTYGVGNESKKKKIDDLILSNFKNGIKEGKSEGIALCYGINRGYSAFHNFYTTGNNKKEVKFQLNSQLDYYTIESVFQYAFNNIKSDKFPYLDWCPKYINTIKANGTNYKILDVVVIGKKKAEVGSEEWFQNLYSIFVEKIKNNFWENGIKNIISDLVKNVILDTRKEYKNKLTAKEEEINTLKAERKELLESHKTAPIKKYEQQEEKIILTVAEPQTIYLTKNKVKQIIEKVYDYQAKNIDMLKKEAKEKGIDISNKAKKDEIIVLLITNPTTNNLQKEIFNE